MFFFYEIGGNMKILKSKKAIAFLCALILIFSVMLPNVSLATQTISTEASGETNAEETVETESEENLEEELKKNANVQTNEEIIEEIAEELSEETEEVADTTETTTEDTEEAETITEEISSESEIAVVSEAGLSTASNSNEYTSRYVATDTYYYTTTHTNGIVAKQVYYNGSWKWVFCVEIGVLFPSGTYEADFVYSSEYDEAYKIAYIGFYKDYGDISDMDSYIKQYSFTQQYIWEVLYGDEAGTFTTSSVQSAYESWKEDLEEELENYDKSPSFNGTEIDIDYGETVTLTDSNKVLEDFSTFDITTEGINFKHNSR